MRYSNVVLAESSLVHYYRLDQLAGTLTDLKGTEHLTASGGATLGAAGALLSDRSDTAVTFATNGVAKNTTHTAVAGASSFTYEVWYKSSTGGVAQTFVGETSVASNTPIMTCYLQAGRVIISPRNNAAVGSAANTSAATWNDGLWHLVWMVGDRAANTVNLYIDDPATSLATASYPAAPYTFNCFCVGALVRTTTSNYMNGPLDEVAVYNAALSQAQRQAHRDAATYLSGCGFFE